MRINIIQIMLDVGVGGTQNCVLNLLRNIDRSKFNPSVCCLWEGGILEGEFRNLNVPLYILKKERGFDIGLIFKLAKLMKKNRINVIHSHHLGPLLYSLTAGKLAGIKRHIHTEHSYTHLLENNKYFLLTKLLSLGIKRLVGVSDNVSSFFRDTMQVDPAKILTIANGIEIEKYHNNGGISKYTKRAEIGLNKDDFVIGTIGRLDPIKNHAGLFRSLKEIIPSIKNVKLVVVGDGNIKTKLESLSTSLGIAPHVKLLGNRIDIPQLLSALDIFILPSFSEGFSLALLEAMAAKKPIIASNVGGNKDIIMHEVNGLLVDPNNTYDIASAVLKLYKDPLVRAKLADSAYELVSEKYSIGAMVKHYETIYLGI